MRVQLIILLLCILGAQATIYNDPDVPKIILNENIVCGRVCLDSINNFTKLNYFIQLNLSDTIFASNFCYLNGTCVSGGGGGGGNFTDTNYSGCSDGEYGDGINRCIPFNATVQDLVNGSSFVNHSSGNKTFDILVYNATTEKYKPLSVPDAMLTESVLTYNGTLIYWKMFVSPYGLTSVLQDDSTTSGEDMTFTTDDKLKFRNSNSVINSSADGFLDLWATNGVNINAVLFFDGDITRIGDENTGEIWSRDEGLGKFGGLKGWHCDEAGTDVCIFCEDDWDECNIGNGHGTSLETFSSKIVDSPNTNFTGNITGNFYYGEMWYQNDTTNGHTVTIPGIGTWVNVTGFDQTTFANQTMNGFEFVDGIALKSQVNGLFKVHYSVSFETLSGANDEIHFGVAINGGFQENTEIHRFISTPGDVGNAGGTGFIAISIDDIITLQALNQHANANLGVHGVDLNLIRIGD